MKKEVLLSIVGLHRGPQTDESEEAGPVEVITPAEYYFKNGKHYLLYDEADPQDGTITHTTLKMKDDYLSVTRRGEYSSQILIEGDRRSVTYYASPFGSLHILLDGRSVIVEEEPSQISARAFYGLEINYEHAADCELLIRVTER